MDSERWDMPRGARAIDAELASRADDAVVAGMAEGKASLLERRDGQRRKALVAAAAFFIIIGCLISIRVSPAFASALRQLPGMKTIVDTINRDYSTNETLLDALNHDYVQRVGLSDAHDGLTFTVDGLVADDSRAIVVYTVDGLRSDEKYGFGRITWRDGDGRELALAYGSSGLTADKMHDGTVTDSVEALFPQQESLPDTLDMEIELRGEPYRVAFKVDKALFTGNKKIIALNTSITVQDQQIVFERAIISPLTIAIEARYPETNTKTIFSAGDMTIVDDAGKEWSAANFSFNSGEPGHARFEFKSSYFRQPNQLYVTGSWFRALDKDQMKLVVDTEAGKIVDAPDGQVSVRASSRAFGKTLLTLGLTTTNPQDSHMGYLLLAGPFTDATGKKGKAEHKQTGLHPWDGERNDIEDSYELPPGDYVQPLTFELYMYPQYIRQDYRIEIPLGSRR